MTFSPPRNSDWWTCMPDAFSSNSGFGMKVADATCPVAEARAAVPEPLRRVDLVERPVDCLVEGDVVEDEELGLRPHEAGVRDAGLEQVALRLLRHVARVTGIGLARDRVED